MDFGIYFENDLFMLQMEKTSYVIALSDGYPFEYGVSGTGI